MTDTIIWIDREKAKLFKMQGGEVVTRHLHAHDPNHHTHILEQSDKESVRLYENVFAQIKDSKEVLVIGPGLAKKHFQTFIETHHQAFKNNVVEYLTVDHPTDAQIREYFELRRN